VQTQRQIHQSILNTHDTNAKLATSNVHAGRAEEGRA
jgi:hypothetical protein